MVFNTTFNNISVISWQSVLLVEETGVPEENVVSSTPRHERGSNSQLQLYWHCCKKVVVNPNPIKSRSQIKYVILPCLKGIYALFNF